MMGQRDRAAQVLVLAVGLAMLAGVAIALANAGPGALDRPAAGTLQEPRP